MLPCTNSDTASEPRSEITLNWMTGTGPDQTSTSGIPRPQKGQTFTLFVRRSGPLHVRAVLKSCRTRNYPRNCGLYLLQSPVPSYPFDGAVASVTTASGSAEG